MPLKFDIIDDSGDVLGSYSPGLEIDTHGALITLFTEQELGPLSATRDYYTDVSFSKAEVHKLLGVLDFALNSQRLAEKHAYDVFGLRNIVRIAANLNFAMRTDCD